MFHQVRRLCTAALVLVGAPLLAQAQSLDTTDASVRFVDANDLPLPPDFVTLRNSEGHIVVPLEGPNGSYLFSNLSRKVTIEFSPKGLKQSSINVILDESPVGRVWLTMMVNPVTGEVKSISQKAVQHQVRPRNKIRNAQTGGFAPSLGIPANDDCANAIPISDGVTAYSTLGATTDGNNHSGAGCQFDGQTYNDIWFTYSATCTGNLTVSTCGTADYDTDLVVYDGIGCTPTDAELLGCSDDAVGCPDFSSEVTVPVVAGNGYLIRVGGFNSSDSGTGMLSIECAGVGGDNNDDCATAPVVDCSGSVSFNNSGNTVDPSDPAYSCRFGAPGQGVGTAWYQFVATTDTVTADTFGSAVSDTLLALYDGTCGSLTEIGCNDDESGGSLLSEVTVMGLTVGNTYYVQVSSFSASSLGDITLNLECGTAGGGGDDCGDPLTVECGGSTTFDNAAFTTDPSDPEYSCRFGAPGQGYGTGWLTFVANNSHVIIDTYGSVVSDTMLAVYDGTCGAFTEIGCNDDAVGLLSEVDLTGLTVGNTYYIQASSFSETNRGDITVNVNCDVVTLENDNCADAIPLGIAPVAVSFDTTGATTDLIDAPCGVASGPWNNVWYTVTGTGTELTASTCNPGSTHPDTKISVFCGDCGTPVCVGGNDDDPAAECSPFLSKVTWCSQPGVEYLVTVGGFGDGQVGPVELTIDAGSAPCTAEVQCLPQGACCLEDGSCVITTGDDCAAQGGTYFGDGSECFSNAIVDGSFEGGAFAGNWTEFSSNFGTPLCDPGSCGFGGGTGPNTGDWWAWFGGIGAFEEGSVEQVVVIPATASTIDFAWEIPVASGNGVDFCRLLIDGSQVFELLESDSTGVGYTSESIALGGFADGAAHTVRFESTITGEGGAFTNFFIDDVSINSQDVTCIVPPDCFTIDFSTEDDFVTPLADGQHINTEFGNLVSLSSTGLNAGMGIFDSSNPGPNNPSQDLDLLTNTGNILILQTENFPVDGSDFFPVPNDDDDGGSVTFAFVSAVAPMSIDLIDIDSSDAAGSVVLTDGSGNTRTYDIPADWTGDLTLAQPGIGTLDLTSVAAQPGFGSIATASEDAGFDGNNVVSITVNLGGSGGIDNLSWCEPTPQ
jgi:hypothetical protein